MNRKIAICYSGLTRNLDDCFPTHMKHIIEANPDDQFYIFAHLWNTSIFPDFTSMNFYPHGMLLHRPFNFTSELTPDPRFPCPMNNVLSMLFSLRKSWEVQENFCKEFGVDFDLVIRTRTDLFFNGDLKLDDYPDDKIVLNQQYIHMPYAVNDLFAFGPPHYMKEYCDVYNRVQELFDKGCAVNPECFVGFNLRESNCEIYQTPLQHHLFEIYRDIKK